MQLTVQNIIEGTITLVLTYLIVTNAREVSGLVRAIGSVYSSSVRTLQGR